MKIKSSCSFQIRCAQAFTFAVALLLTSSAFAQIGASSGQSQGAQAVQLPLSGRTGQNGSVATTQTTVPGTTTSVNTLNPTIQVQGPFGGSADSTAAMPFSGKLSLREAVQRGLQYNLGAVGLAQAVRQAQGASRVARAALLPNLNGTASGTRETEDLKALGFNFNFPGFAIPTIIGPFNYMDVRAKLTQTVADLAAINNYRSAEEISRAEVLSARDARELVVLAVGGSYLEVIAAEARVQSARAQLDTANALYQQALQQRGVGLLAQLDVNRSQVQALTQQQRLTSLENDLAKQKINLARLTGLPVTDSYDVSDSVPFSVAPSITLDEALKQALDQRSDLKAAEAQVRAAERAHSAARAERLPSLSVSADYGVIGPGPSQLQGTYTVVGTLHVPIWQGGRAEGDIEEADAALNQRRAELEDLKGQIQADVHNAYLDLQSAASQVDVSQKNLEVSRETLDLTRQRFEAGVTDSVEVVQSQQEVATAELDYINSVFAHNVAKLSLARAVGGAAANLEQFLKLP